MAHYPTLEDDKQLEGNADAYYGYQAYHQARGEGIKTGNEECFKKANSLIRQLKYIIKKDTDGNLTEITLLENDKALDLKEEMRKGLDRITVSHLWRGDPYRFSHISIKPIGKIRWLAPDLFYWYSKI